MNMEALARTRAFARAAMIVEPGITAPYAATAWRRVWVSLGNSVMQTTVPAEHETSGVDMADGRRIAGLPATPAISVLIATRNRAEYLRASLSVLAGLRAPPGAMFEVVLVDNGSNDDTRQVIEDFRASAKNCKVCYLHEPVAGKSFALNRGLRHCHGKVLLLTDDDVRPGPTWLRAMTEPILSGQAEIAYGPVVLAPELWRSWMTEFHLGCLACFERGPPSVRRAASANLAMLREPVMLVGGFDVNLGPGRTGFGDETLLLERMLAETEVRAVGVGRAGMVVHHLDPQRLLRPSWISHAQRTGRSLAYIDHHYLRKCARYGLLRQVNGMLRLAWFRYRYRNLVLQSEGIDYVEYELIRRIAYWRLMRTLSGVRPNYPTAPPSTAAPAASCPN